MKSTIAKRSVVIGGHKTSVSLEEPFWQGVRDITAIRNITVSELLREIDEKRSYANLSSAVRVFVLENAREKAEAVRSHRQNEIGATLPRALPPSGMPVD